ncbi:uncharacterized protein LOC132699506 [Cylas formicarius]|uniref:uncharacterized protein LOC132699506 n=1 Tax=Cylas formicarius TaxID=197179 RepID=UPI0029589270|nr:uncharacterized protein LOC132699506 [Cylas formicarius]
MSSQFYLAVVFGLVLAAFPTAFGLQCWKCSSDQDATCRDHFNVTRILQNQRFINSYVYGNQQTSTTTPHLTTCEGMHTSTTFGQVKNVCVKRVTTATHGLKQVIRECRMVNINLKTGACPEDLAYPGVNQNLEYCGSCEYDGCNSASMSQIIVALLIPSLLLLLRG